MNGSKASDCAGHELIDIVAMVTLDDGKANGFGPDMIAVHAHLDRAAKEARAVVVTGREGILSSGFDLRVIRGREPQAASAMLDAGARLMTRLHGLPPLETRLPWVPSAADCGSPHWRGGRLPNGLA